MKKDRKVTCFKIAQNSIYFFALFILVLILLFQVSDIVRAITEMVPNLILAPDFFGPLEIWALRKLGPEKFGPSKKIIIWHFNEGAKFLADK